MVFTQYDIKILANIIDPNDNKKGLGKMTATTVKEIVDRTNFSDKKVRMALKKFLEEEMIAYGIAYGRTKTYYILPKGLEELDSLYELEIEEDDE
ncbi:hypothetical protein P5E90_12170 [Clostridium perfringens]|nr:hypothetical protein [Clostridium perfringens]